MRPRIILADEQALVVEGIRRLLEPEFAVIEVCDNGRKLVARALEMRPELVVLEVFLPLLDGFDAALKINKAAPEIRLVFLTSRAAPEYVSEALRCGASGYVLKRSTPTDLISALHEVLDGGRHITPLVGAINTERRASGLTGRQLQVLRLIAEGRTTKEIAALLLISVKTVEFHRGAITQRLGLRTVAELTRYAISHGIS